MDFHGFQKMTLLDYPGKVACTLFTGGCNLRCPFCHNAFLVTQIDNSYLYPEDEILDFLSKRKGLLDGVCITGGEPLMQKDISSFIKKVKDLGFPLKLDTNGCYTDKLAELIDNNLVDYVAMDIKNSKEKYAKTVGIENLDLAPIENSVEILKSGKVDFEFRTTVIKEFHEVDDFEKIGQWIKGAPRYFLQGFTDSGNLIGENMNPVDKETMLKMRDKALDFVDLCEIRGVD
ncbi:MAG: anaerobic ribonucleoside-triphosphate reductase activating protein [Clostridiales bacterium]|nr:anaerobic ribonucleoside-triphosphate reductase activating protein [Clostridiales bacterium]